jgi:hypothetical protein
MTLPRSGSTLVDCVVPEVCLYTFLFHTYQYMPVYYVLNTNIKDMIKEGSAESNARVIGSCFMFYEHLLP